ncbi:hypothetical protein GWN26_02100 [Candidatus Saccharibacteria bacterium]|nr:hypothetical protein [Phycisphaerae bacterium]NIV97993.1 hypothetical protein [Candidatus Saccharibacteria bacterium]
MLTRCLILIGIMSIMPVVIGCSGTAPIAEQGLLERNWGRSFETIRYMQMVNPEAGKNLDPVLGLDGNASDHNINKYQESFKDQQLEQSETILKLQ